MALTAAGIKGRARALGFSFCGITPAVPSATLAAYLRWIQRGMQGSMGYMARPDRISRRRDLRVILPGAQTLIVVGMDYAAQASTSQWLEDPSRGRIASYAWGLDYHDVMLQRLEALAQWLMGASGGKLSQRVYVDTGAILERSHAQQAGLGFIGKNTMLIHPRRGSSFFIGEIISTWKADAHDAAQRETMCGTCTRCLRACPTDAFPSPFVLDARRCISYHTIENKGWVPRELRGSFGNWVFGCDICQEVCPFQRFADAPSEAAFLPPTPAHMAPRLQDLLALSERAFDARFRGSPVQRIGRARMLRNACIAAGNWRDASLRGLLKRLLGDSSAHLRGHAAWALWRIDGARSHRSLQAMRQRESSAQVQEEIAALLALPSA